MLAAFQNLMNAKSTKSAKCSAILDAFVLLCSFPFRSLGSHALYKAIAEDAEKFSIKQYRILSLLCPYGVGQTYALQEQEVW